MKRLLLLTAVVGSFALPASADAMWSVVREPCPENPAAMGCVDSVHRVIWVRPDLHPAQARLTILHEWGHAISAHYLLPYQQRQIQRNFGWSRWMEERWADAVAVCRYGIERSRGKGFGTATPKQCELVKRLSR